VIVWPFAMTPSGQGKLPHGPEAMPVNVRPATAGSASDTPVAYDGPLLVTAIV